MASLPEPLREKLGSKAADGLVAYVHTVLEDGKTQVIGTVEERFARRVGESESRLRGELHDLETRFRGELRDSEARLRGEISESEARLRGEISESETRLRGRISEIRGEVNGLRQDMNQKFERMDGHVIRIYEKFADIHHQITVQTRWLIGVAAFIAIVFKLLDIFI